MTTWLRLIALGVFGTTLTAACQLTVNDDDDNDDDIRAGRAGAPSAGRSGGGAGGTSAGTAGAAMAGTTQGGAGMAGSGMAEAGMAGASDGIDDLSCTDPPGVPTDSCEFNVGPDSADFDCLSCLTQNCCTEVRGCYATMPHNLCGYGGPDGVEEYQCYRLCLIDTAEASGAMSYTEDDMVDCALDCATPSDKDGNACNIIGDRTNELLSCMHADCEIECLDSFF